MIRCLCSKASVDKDHLIGIASVLDKAKEPARRRFCRFWTWRCVKAFDELKKRNLQEDCALIVHGGTIMAIMEQCAEPASDYYSFRVQNGNGYVLYPNGHYEGFLG